MGLLRVLSFLTAQLGLDDKSALQWPDMHARIWFWFKHSRQQRRADEVIELQSKQGTILTLEPILACTALPPFMSLPLFPKLPSSVPLCSVEQAEYMQT